MNSEISYSEPSWTGLGSKSSAEIRIKKWLSNADTKRVIPPNAGEAFTENINWRIFRIMAEFVEGFEFLSTLKKEVTFFGSAVASPSNRYYRVAKQLGYLCGKAGYTVITGGGPGMMEAANWGAYEAGGESVGLDISLPLEQRRNQYVKKAIGFHYFFTRKVMLSASAQAYVFLPGGFGTLDELFEIVTLIQTGKMSDAVPVILIGRAFWHSLLAWIERVVKDEYQFMDEQSFKILNVVDTAEEAFDLIKKTKERIL
ncbi:MAG TPA: TIGR00730 family Rossman fold protein [Patescibacteria group bacterium]|nr:TIGR00730 family Rossman fold protein [Patescibacteria group bacterium]